MTNSVKNLVLVAALLLVGVGSLFGQKVTVIAENANLRDAPSNTAKVVTVLSNGTEIVVLNQYGGWFRVQRGKFTGWVHGNAISPVDDEKNLLDNCASCVTTLKDRMTDRVLTVGIDKVMVSPMAKQGLRYLCTHFWTR